MKLINYVSGDLFGPMLADNGPGAIVIPHIVNTKGAWGSGFVVPLGRKYPSSKERYENWHSTQRDRNIPFQLGNTQFVRVSKEEPNIIVANMLAQTLGGSRPLYYQHLAACMTQVGDFCEMMTHQLGTPARIHAPAFGAGLARGDWAFINELIYDCWMRDANIPVSIYFLPGTVPDVEREAERVAIFKEGELQIKRMGKALDPDLETEIAQALADEPSTLTNLQHRLETETPEEWNDDIYHSTDRPPFDPR